MSTVNEAHEGTVVLTKGALERVLPLCTSIMINGKTERLVDVYQDDITHAYHVMMDMGLRVLAFAHVVLGVRHQTEHEATGVTNPRDIAR